MRHWWASMPLTMTLLGYSLRGHRAPPDVLTLTADELAWARAHRVKTPSEAATMPTGAREFLPRVVEQLCQGRSGRCHEVVVGRTCLYARVEIPDYFQKGLAQAVRLVAGREAAKTPGWPKGRRLFTSHERMWALEDKTWTFKERAPWLNEF